MREVWKGFVSVLGSAIAAFLAYKRALGRRYESEEHGLRLLDRFLAQGGVKALDDVTPDVIGAFLLSRPRLKARSYNCLLGTLAQLFKWMVRQGALDHSPVHVQRRRAAGQRVPFLFDKDTARQLLKAASALREHKRAPLRGPTYRAVFALMYGLGLRVGEVCRLSCEDLDLERSVLTVRNSKFDKSRLVPFGPRMAAMLSSYLELRRSPGSALFSFVGQQPINRHTVDRTFQKLIKRINIHVPSGTSCPRVHDLRHSFAVARLLQWYREDQNPSGHLFQLSTFLGHVDPSSTAVYLNMTEELLHEANRRFEHFALQALEGVGL